MTIFQGLYQISQKNFVLMSLEKKKKKKKRKIWENRFQKNEKIDFFFFFCLFFEFLMFCSTIM